MDDSIDDLRSGDERVGQQKPALLIPGSHFLRCPSQPTTHWGRRETSLHGVSYAAVHANSATLKCRNHDPLLQLVNRIEYMAPVCLVVTHNMVLM